MNPPYPAQSHPSDGRERYCCRPDILTFPVGDNSELVYAARTRSVQIIPELTSKVLQGWRSFRTVSEQAKQMCRLLDGSEERIGLVEARLSDLVAAGLVISESSLIRQFRDGSEPRIPPLKITSLGIPTRNRVGCLERAIVSYIENSRQHSRTIKLQVVDDSDSSPATEAVPQMLAELRHRYGSEILYSSQEERKQFADALVRDADLPPDVANFGLLNPENFPISVGASRNFLLLHNMGDVFVTVDDDTVCRIAVPAQSETGLTLSSLPDPTRFRFFPDIQAALDSNVFVDEDFLGIHEQLLGRDVGSCISALTTNADLDLDQIGPRFVRNLQLNRGTVALTSLGVIGDCGLGRPSHFLLQAAAHEQLMRSESEYRSAVTSRQVSRSVGRTTISDVTFSQSLNLGFDCRTMLPPFMPVQRNQDGIFFTLLRACLPDAYVGLFPRALLHQPPGVQSFPADANWRCKPAFDTADLVKLILSLPFSFEPSANQPLSRGLYLVGKYLAEVGSLPLADFHEMLRIHLWRAMSLRLIEIENRLRESGGQPEYWANDLRMVTRLSREAILRDDLVAPFDLREHYGLDAALDLFKKLLYEFGRLLQYWPQIMEAATEFRARGRIFAKHIS